MNNIKRKIVLLLCISLISTSISSFSYADTISDNDVEIGAFGVSEDSVSDSEVIEENISRNTTNDSEESESCINEKSTSENNTSRNSASDNDSAYDTTSDNGISDNSISDNGISDNAVDDLGISENTVSDDFVEDELCGYNPLPEEDYAEVIDGIYIPEEDPNLESSEYDLEDGSASVCKEFNNSPMLFSLAGDEGVDNLGEDALPVEYKTPTNKLSPLKSQTSNTCWTYSSMAMAEASMMAIPENGLDKSNGIDYSEYHLAYFSYNSPNDPLGGINGDVNRIKDTSRYNILTVGGNYLLAQNILAAWIGAADDSKYKMKSGIYSIDASKAQDDSVHMKGYYNLNINSDRDNAKRLIKTYGAVGISYYSNSSLYYDSTNNSYYCPTNIQSNHAVAVVGWDDNFDKNNFKNNSTIENNGAWYIRNSYTSVDGTESYSGYFWMSYEDKSLKNEAYCYIFEPASLHDNNYQYDGGMYSTDFSINSAKTVKGANVFKAKANSTGEKLDSVSFFVPKANYSYVANVYKITDPKKPTTGTRIATKSGETTFPGYYSVSFDSPVYLRNGEMFSVVMTYTSKDGQPARLACDRNYSATGSFFITTVHNEQNQSFYSASSTWDDITKLNGVGNLRIKAQTSNVVLPSKISINASTLNLSITKTHDLQPAVIPSNADDSSITWTSSDPSVATVSTTGEITAVGAGSATIQAKANMGGVTSECQVTVRDTFDINYVLNKGTLGDLSPTSYQYNVGTAVDLVNPLRQGYNFLGWYTKSDFTVAPISQIPMGATEDYTLFAKWEPIQSTLTYDYNSGSYDPVPASISSDEVSMCKVVCYDDLIGNLPFLTSSTRSFAGWYTAAVGGSLVTKSQIVDFTSDKTIYAHWSERPGIAVKLDSGGGSLENSTIEVENGDVYGNLPEPSRARYIFDGWYTSPTDGTKIEEDTEVWILASENSSVDQTLYAHYSAIGFNTSLVNVIKGKKIATGFNQPGATYKTSNKAVATVDSSGRVKGIKKGSATITATLNGQKYTCKIKVYDKPSMTGVNQLKINKSKKFKVKDGYGTVVWSSSNPAVATVTQNGKVKAIKKGRTDIIAYKSGYKMKIKLRVTK